MSVIKYENVKIGKNSFSLFIDHDRPLLNCLNYKEKVLYFDRRVRKIFLNPLNILRSKYVFNKLEPKDRSSIAWIIIVSLICSGIDSLGGFYAGRDAKKDTFLKFLYKYMNKDFKKRKYNKETYGMNLRENFRNNLTHGFCIRHGGVEEFNGYFKISKKIGLQINSPKLLADFNKAFESYMRDLKNAKPTNKIAKNFVKRFDSVWIHGK